MPQGDKGQESLERIKKIFFNEDQDYIINGDGSKRIFCKCWKNWEPKDLVTLKKEDDSFVFDFILEALARRRFDLLEGILPDYYRNVENGKALFIQHVKAAQNGTLQALLDQDKGKGKTGAVIDGEAALHSDIAQDRTTRPAFDQQAALDLLAKNEVKMFDATAVDPKLNQIVLNMKAEKAAKETGKQVA